MSIEWTPQAHKVVEARPYTGRTLQLDAADIAFFSSKYELEEWTSARYYIAVDEASNRYVLPFYGPQRWGGLRGHVLRMPWEGAPRTAYAAMKADTYKINPADPLLAWYVASNT